MAGAMPLSGQDEEIIFRCKYESSWDKVALWVWVGGGGILSLPVMIQFS